MEIGQIVIGIIWLLFIVMFFAVRLTMGKIKNRTAKQIRNQAGYDDDGYDQRGFSPLGFHRNGTRYDDQGFDKQGNRKPHNE